MAEANETKLCENCHRQISANNFMMHEMHCRRHISLCKYCKEPIPKGEMEVHVGENHAKIPCAKCGIQVEKMHLEDHEENSCEKRPQKCLYCDLEFPKNELTAHLDYCGSRTEPCTKCGQYIRLKDQQKHEESNCAFPPVKPANNERNTAENGQIRDHPFDIYGHSSNIGAARNEFDRALGLQPTLGELGVPQVPLVTTKRERERGNGVARTNVFNSGRPGKSVNTKAVKRSDLNLKKETPASGQSLSAEDDYDHLLAMHLAQDLNQGNDIDELIRRMEKPEPVLPQSPGVGTNGLEMNRFTEDLSMIPCEFCGEPFIADDLVHHQSGCSLDRISAMLPQMSAATNRRDGLNNASDSSPLITERPLIIDNLRNFSAEDWLDDTDPVGVGEEESMLLPCEFCSELFPMDMLVQHQAVCDSNGTMTPRVQSPAVTKPRLQKKKISTITNTKLTNLTRLEADLPNLMSRRHQAPPRLPLSDDSDDNDIASGATHRVLKPNTGAVSSTGSNIRKTPKRYGAESQDRSDYVTKQGSYSRSFEENRAAKRTDPLHNKHRTGSDVRTRGTLDSLLDDADESSRDLLANISIGGRKMVKNDVNSRQKVGVGNRTVPQRGVTKPKPTVVGREVLRDINSHSSQSTTSTTRNRTRALDDPPFEIRPRPVDIEERVPAQRSRQRANQVFGSQARQQKRRSENS